MTRVKQILGQSWRLTARVRVVKGEQELERLLNEIDDEGPRIMMDPNVSGGARFYTVVYRESERVQE